MTALWILVKTGLIVGAFCVISMGKSTQSGFEADQDTTRFNFQQALFLRGVLVMGGQFWHHYRQAGDTYYVTDHLVRRKHVMQKSLFVCMGDDPSIMVQNPEPGTILSDEGQRRNLVDLPSTLDKQGIARSVIRPTVINEALTWKRLAALLSGQSESYWPLRRRLSIENASSLLIYWTGHGAIGSLAIRDSDMMFAADVGRSLNHLFTAQQGYKLDRLLVIIDACKAASIWSEAVKYFDSKLAPHEIIHLASSAADQNSYAEDFDPRIGVPMIDKFTKNIFYSMSTDPLISTERLWRWTASRIAPTIPVIEATGEIPPSLGALLKEATPGVTIQKRFASVVILDNHVMARELPQPKPLPRIESTQTDHNGWWSFNPLPLFVTLTIAALCTPLTVLLP